MVQVLKKIIIIVLVIAIPLSLCLYKEYHRKPADLLTIQPAVKVNAGALLDEYERD